MDRSKLLKVLAGRWTNYTGETGWNMVAFPALQNGQNYRLTTSQYLEELVFKTLSAGVINHGINNAGHHIQQSVTPLSYKQKIRKTSDSPLPDDVNNPGSGETIHEELGMFLFASREPLPDDSINNYSLSRVGVTSRGNSILTSGTACTSDRHPIVVPRCKLPEGVGRQAREYLAQYIQGSSYAFDTKFPERVLVRSNKIFFRKNREIIDVTKIHFFTGSAMPTVASIPFLSQHAPVTEFESTFWLYRMRREDKEIYRLQYSQTSILEFGKRKDGQPGKIRWPHVSVNTLEKVALSPPS